MEELENRIKHYGWRIKDVDTLEGLHAGSIHQVSVFYKENRTLKLIYKEFADNRNNEVDIYNKLLPYIKSLTPVIKVWNTEPEAILMTDLNDPLKNSFDEMPLSAKEEVLKQILHELMELHKIPTSNFINSSFPIHTPSTDWYEWCIGQFKKLNGLNLAWYKCDWIDKVRHSFQSCRMNQYEIKGPIVITHGDPHFDNIFLKKDGTISFIDWEWAALGSPLRDSSILLQDLYDSELVNFVKDNQYKLLYENGFYQDERVYKEDFHHLYIEHFYMMLAWKIEKFKEGYITEEKLMNIIKFKIDQIQNSSIALQLLSK